MQASSGNTNLQLLAEELRAGPAVVSLSSLPLTPRMGLSFYFLEKFSKIPHQSLQVLLPEFSFNLFSITYVSGDAGLGKGMANEIIQWTGHLGPSFF